MTSAEIEVGDAVDVPGAMHGTVRFIGSVKGKKGTFAGVELSREFASRGKNDGDVEGIRYFTTSKPNAGIFLPLARASKRASPALSPGSIPNTPKTPSLPLTGARRGKGDSSFNVVDPTATGPKFSQSVGPGRAPSPQFKPRSRPSLPRPESPLRKQQNALSTPAGRTSLGGPPAGRAAVATPRYAPSPTPGKFGASVRGTRDSNPNAFGGDPGKRAVMTPRPGPRTPAAAKASNPSGRNSFLDEIEDNDTPIGLARTSDGSYGSAVNTPGYNGQGQRGSGGGGNDDDDVKRLRSKLEERDRQLAGQAASLAEMEHSFIELQSLLPSGGGGGRTTGRGAGSDDADSTQLRAILREKNERIATLTAEFDAHRADFRSTIDTLELASTETERVYEKRVEDLLQEIRDLQDRGEDVESVARQLKQLEELVQELEEGLEDARRGEAEARGEVEFLRGEVERGRSELQREREKAAAALKGAGAAVDIGGKAGGEKEVEQRDDEIRGLKAIIHSLSRDAVPDAGPGRGSIDGKGRSNSQRRGSGPKTNGAEKRSSMQSTEDRLVRERLEREVKELQGLVERKAFKEEELEREMERLRKERAASKPGQQPGQRASNSSEKTVVQGRRSLDRDSKGTTASWRNRSPEPGRHATLETMPERESDSYSSDAEGGALWCEICETTGHDILTCTNMFGPKQPMKQNGVKSAPSAAAPAAAPSPPSAQRTAKESSVSEAGGSVAPLLSASRKAHVANDPPIEPPPPAMPNPLETGMVAGKTSGVIDPNRWCALCERDGHESVDCPFEDAF
ncbi:MAG: hypothetical protein M1825_002958 [Sarcosagium campestre]|nr:MAG: hypothetical protein M1825_002958 [Sarcosagium campestre]